MHLRPHKVLTAKGLSTLQLDSSPHPKGRTRWLVLEDGPQPSLNLGDWVRVTGEWGEVKDLQVYETVKTHTEYDVDTLPGMYKQTRKKLKQLSDENLTKVADALAKVESEYEVPGDKAHRRAVEDEIDERGLDN